jgi:hypothetical protein
MAADDTKPEPRPVEVHTEIVGCGRWVPNRGACALPAGHSGACVPVGGQ